VESSHVQFDHLQEASSLVARIWEAGTLLILQDGPLRYSEVGNRLAVWSGRRPSDSAITRALKRLTRTGFVIHTGGGSDHRRGIYTITISGRQRAARISLLTRPLDDLG
jgi:DNA-binding PadR family transcriptional regulator